MQTQTLLSTAALAAALVGGGALVLPASAQSGAVAPRTTAAALTLRQVLEKVEAAGYRDITEAERRRDRYEIDATDRDGRRVELDVDGLSGEIRAVEIKRDKRDRRDERSDRRSSAGDGSAMAPVVVSAAAGQPGEGWRYYSDAAAGRAVVISPEGDYYLNRGKGLQQVTGTVAGR